MWWGGGVGERGRERVRGRERDEEREGEWCARVHWSSLNLIIISKRLKNIILILPWQYIGYFPFADPRLGLPHFLHISICTI